MLQLHNTAENIAAMQKLQGSDGPFASRPKALWA
jgi:hypothetical protein